MKCDTQHNDTQHNGRALLCRVLFMLTVTYAECLKKPRMLKVAMLIVVAP